MSCAQPPSPFQPSSVCCARCRRDCRRSPGRAASDSGAVSASSSLVKMSRSSAGRPCTAAESLATAPGASSAGSGEAEHAAELAGAGAVPVGIIGEALDAALLGHRAEAQEIDAGEGRDRGGEGGARRYIHFGRRGRRRLANGCRQRRGRRGEIAIGRQDIELDGALGDGRELLRRDPGRLRRRRPVPLRSPARRPAAP